MRNKTKGRDQRISTNKKREKGSNRNQKRYKIDFRRENGLERTIKKLINLIADLKPTMVAF